MNEDNKKYFLFPADFRYYNIGSILDEKKASSGVVRWVISKSMDIKEDDVAYLYFHDITGEKEGRILLAATIKSVNKDSKTPLIIPKEDGIEEIYSNYVELSNIKVVGHKEITKFTYHDLKDNFGLKVNQSKQLIGIKKDLFDFNKGDIFKITAPTTKTHEKNNTESNERYLKNLKLIKAVNDSIKFNNSVSLSELKQKYEKICECCENNKTTFIKQNGLYYYEQHHLIMRNIHNATKREQVLKKDLLKIINNSNFNMEESYNKINLCPVCHRELHYGLSENKKKNLNKILSKHKDAYINIFSNHDKLKELISLVYRQYGVVLDDKDLKNIFS